MAHALPHRSKTQTPYTCSTLIKPVDHDYQLQKSVALLFIFFKLANIYHHRKATIRDYGLYVIIFSSLSPENVIKLNHQQTIDIFKYICVAKENAKKWEI